MLRLLRWLIARGWLTPYSQGHLFHADGSLYMGRWQVFTSRWLSCRLHHIATPDFDRHMHDHPWNFASVLLCGGYVEARPVDLDPCFEPAGPGRVDWEDERRERATTRARRPGSLAFRRATDRHRITAIEPDTYSLFIYWRKLQWWGFYTPWGKVHWMDYPSCHAAGADGKVIEERE